MTTATRPTPAHGTEARYQGAAGRPGCRCTECTRGWSRAGQRRRLAHLEGRPPKLPASPVTEHINNLLDAGMSISRIAKLAGVGRDTISDHSRSVFPTILRNRATRILAVRPDDRDNNGLVPALGTRRRLQTLYAAGHGAYLIASKANGLTPRAIDYILNGQRSSVTIATRDAVATAYTALAAKAGSSPTSRTRAVAAGWPGPGYWDADDFDNPDFQPATGATRIGRDELAAHRRAEVEHLDSFGLSENDIAGRLGMAVSTVKGIVLELRRGERRNRKQIAA